MGFLTPEEQWALGLSTFAGLCTSIGAAAAVVKRPDDALLAFLLGIAIGVMFLLSLVELWLRNAAEHGWAEVTFAVLLGALAYQLLQPFIPDFQPEVLVHSAASEDEMDRLDAETLAAQQLALKAAAAHERPYGAVVRQSARRGDAASVAPAAANGSIEGGGLLAQKAGSAGRGASAQERPRTPTAREVRTRSAELLRLGMLMAVTMTLHNAPEGFAVAFASFTPLGPIMALAIATHNLAEGVIVAAPVYAATGSRWKALAIATASGLSEPLGGLVALLVVRPYLSSSEWLQVMLAFVGGIMMAVCALELWPEGKKCRHDRRLLSGVAVGAVVMGWTLWMGA